jgi:hypothetical protein
MPTKQLKKRTEAGVVEKSSEAPETKAEPERNPDNLYTILEQLSLNLDNLTSDVDLLYSRLYPVVEQIPMLAVPEDQGRGDCKLARDLSEQVLKLLKLGRLVADMHRALRV